MATAAPPLQLLDLPTELFEHIFLHLEHKDIESFAKTCKQIAQTYIALLREPLLGRIGETDSEATSLSKIKTIVSLENLDLPMMRALNNPRCPLQTRLLTSICQASLLHVGQLQAMISSTLAKIHQEGCSARSLSNYLASHPLNRTALQICLNTLNHEATPPNREIVELLESMITPAPSKLFFFNRLLKWML